MQRYVYSLTRLINIHTPSLHIGIYYICTAYVEDEESIYAGDLVTIEVVSGYIQDV